MATTDNTYMQWTYALLSGIGKELAVGKKITGNTLFFYNTLKTDHNPYPSKFILRVGLDLSLKKDQRRQFIKRLGL